MSRKGFPKIESFDSDPDIVRLKQYLSRKKWTPTIDLRLRNFPLTGRGVCSTQDIHEGDILIEIPFNFMISFCTVIKSKLYQRATNPERLKIEDYLSAYLAIERRNTQSEWKWYIDTLPKEAPSFPWLCKQKYIKFLPEDLQKIVLEHHNLYESSLSRVLQYTNLEKRLDLNDYFWAYAMVLTRSVHVDPDIVQKLANGAKLCDNPNMALCPYLDMFNHSNTAQISATLQEDTNKYKFKLITHKSYKAHEQIFIFYGQRDNFTLLCHYGFFTNNVHNEKIAFSLEEIVKFAQLLITSEQRKYIQQHRLDQELEIFVEGLSYNLKALLFVLFNPNRVYEWNTVIYTENYTNEDLQKMHEFGINLLQKVCAKKVELQYNKAKEVYEGDCKHYEIILDYMKCRISYVQTFIDICKNKIINNCFT